MERLEFKMRRKHWMRRRPQLLGTQGFLVVGQGRICPSRCPGLWRSSAHRGRCGLVKPHPKPGPHCCLVEETSTPAGQRGLVPASSRALTGGVRTIKFFLSEAFLGQHWEAVELEGREPEPGDPFLFRLLFTAGHSWACAVATGRSSTSKVSISS